MAFEEWPFTDAWSLHGNKDIVSRYEILERIGEGTFGEVHRARRREDGLIVALKEIHNSDSSCREVKALLLVEHPNVVKMHEYFVQGNSVVLVLEYLPYNLFEVVRAAKGGVSEGEVKGWMVQFLRGLAACHAASILHRDLKPNNLLISGDGILKIADFGQARVLSQVDSVKEELYGSEKPETSVAGSDSHSIQEGPTESANIEVELQADAFLPQGEIGDDVSVEHAELQMSQKAEVPSDYFDMEVSHSAGPKNSRRVTLEHVPRGTEFETSDSVLKVSQDLDGNGMHSVSCPTNVGYSAMADAVKGARNYFTVEEMVRSETGMDGLGMSGLQREQITGLERPQNPGNCGGLPLESAENCPGLTRVRHSPHRNGHALKQEKLAVEACHSTEKGDDLSSDESDVDWKGQDGTRNEEFMDTLKKTGESQKAGVSAEYGMVEGDFLQKLRRFMRKRTRRLHTEGKFAGPAPSKNERIYRGGGGGHALQMYKSPVAKKSSSTHERNSVNVESMPSAALNVHTRSASADESVVSSQGKHVILDAPLGKGETNFHGREVTNSTVGTTSDSQGSLVAEGGGREHMDAVKDKYSMQQCLSTGVARQMVRVLTEMEKCEDDEVMVGGEDGDLRDESGRKLYGGLQEAKGERIGSRLVLNGPLREMAYASAHEVGVTVCKGQAIVNDDYHVGEVDTCSGVGPTSSMTLKKSKGVLLNATGQDGNRETGHRIPWHNDSGVELPDPPVNDVVGGNKFASLSAEEKNRKDVSSVGEMVQERWDGMSAELASGKDVCGWWEQMGEDNSTLSDAEGTRWYGAPEFQYSYMDSKNVTLTGGKVRGETYDMATGSQDEWEDGSEDAHCRKNGRFSQESSGGLENVSENGSDFTTMVGTRWYKAPELLYGATKYGKGVDIWAVGCIFGELLWGKAIFPGLNDIDQLSRLVRILGSPSEKTWAGVSLLPDFNKICFVDDRSPLTLKNYLPNISDVALHFLQKLLTYDPVRRLSADEALEDTFFFREPLPYPHHQLQLPTMDESEASDEEWGDWKDPGETIEHTIESLWNVPALGNFKILVPNLVYYNLDYEQEAGEWKFSNMLACHAALIYIIHPSSKLTVNKDCVRIWVVQFAASGCLMSSMVWKSNLAKKGPISDSSFESPRYGSEAVAHSFIVKDQDMTSRISQLL